MQLSQRNTHVALVVFAIDILTIPARRQEHLRPQFRTWLVRHIIGLRRRSVFSNAHVGDRPLGKVGVIIGPRWPCQRGHNSRQTECLTDDWYHQQRRGAQLEALWRHHFRHRMSRLRCNCMLCPDSKPPGLLTPPTTESNGTVVAYIPVILHQLECSIFRAVIELRDPIIALVDYHAACRLVRLRGRVEFHRLLKCGSSRNYVDVSSSFAGEHNRVGSLDSQCFTAKGEFVDAFRQRGAVKRQHQARGKNTTGLHSALFRLRQEVNCSRQSRPEMSRRRDPMAGVLALFMRSFPGSLACCLLGRI